MKRDSRIYVAGHTGLLGSAFLRRLLNLGYTNLITRTRNELNLFNSNAVRTFFSKEQPEYVILCAARVGGIKVNKEMPATFIYENLAIETNVIESAYSHGVRRLMFFGSSCMFAKTLPQPFCEKDLFSGGPLEETSRAYAIAKLAGVEMCRSYNKEHGTKFLVAIPATLYGPNDSFDFENSHVVSGLMVRLHDAKKNGLDEVVLWGSGNPRREVLYVDDAVSACFHLLTHPTFHEITNIGIEKDYSVCELAECISRVVGFSGRINWDISKPDGVFQKLLDSSNLQNSGWNGLRTSLSVGIQQTYQWFLESYLSK